MIVGCIIIEIMLQVLVHAIFKYKPTTELEMIDVRR